MKWKGKIFLIAVRELKEETSPPSNFRYWPKKGHGNGTSEGGMINFYSMHVLNFKIEILN